MKPYTLEITFTGMCGFVPRPDAVHVLFPDTARPDAHGGGNGGHGGGGHGVHAHPAGSGSGTDPVPAARPGHGGHAFNEMADVHASRLMFDLSALTEGAAERLHVPGVVSLRKRQVEFGGDDPLDASLTPYLAPVGTLKAGFLDGAANDYISTRVVLRAGSQARAHSGAQWKVPTGTVRPMSHRLTWKIGGLTTPLRLTLHSLRQQIAHELPPLFPDASGRLSLFLYHVPGVELPPEPHLLPEPPRDAVAHHFAAFGQLVDEPVALPRYAAPPLPATARDDAHEFERGFSPYACMGGLISAKP